MGAGEVFIGWDFIEEVELLIELLEGGRWHGGWQQGKNVDAGSRLGRRSCLIRCCRTVAGKGGGSRR